MNLKTKLSTTFILLTFFLFLNPTYVSARELPSGGEMLLDMAIARPMGLASFALGLGVFVAASPFTLASGTFKSSAKRLVVYPAKFTFVRGLGDFPGYMEEYEVVEE